MNQYVYLVLFAVIALGSLALAAWLSLRVKGTGIWKPLLVVLGVGGFGVTIACHWPLRQARVIADTQYFEKGPFTFRYLSGGPESSEVKLLLTNGCGTPLALDIERDSREITFSHVRVPDEVQF